MCFNSLIAWWVRHGQGFSGHVGLQLPELAKDPPGAASTYFPSRNQGPKNSQVCTCSFYGKATLFATIAGVECEPDVPGQTIILFYWNEDWWLSFTAGLRESFFKRDQTTDSFKADSRLPSFQKHLPVHEPSLACPSPILVA